MTWLNALLRRHTDECRCWSCGGVARFTRAQDALRRQQSARR